MPKIMRPDLKQEIQEAAWKLFYEKGYENTTVNDIVRAAGTSKGGFYYYFEAKEALLNSLYPILDRAYEKYYRNMSRAGGAMEQIKQMNQYVFYFIEGNVRRDLLVALYQSQLSQRKEQHFLNPNRYYMRLLKQAGMDIVTLNVFSWALLQSSEEEYHFEELDKIMELVCKVKGLVSGNKDDDMEDMEFADWEE